MHYPEVSPIFQSIDEGRVIAVTSVITLSECLVHPCLRGLIELQNDYFDLIVHCVNVEFVLQDEQVGLLAAQLRACYRITLPDALQVATALQSRCDAFLTNDTELKRVQEIQIVVVQELSL